MSGSPRLPTKVAELAASLNAADRKPRSPILRSKSKAYNWSRAHTISSAAPMSHGTPQISEERKEKFEQLDLDILLHEFKAVADEEEEGAKGGPGSEEEEEEEEKAGAAAAESDGASEKAWLANAGMGSLADKVAHGKPITQDDIQAETAGFTPMQVSAVVDRAKVLNSTISKKRKSSKTDARGLWEPVPEKEMTVETTSRLSDLTDEAEEPATRFYDLSGADQQQVQCLNLIQLTSLMDHVTNKQFNLNTKAGTPNGKKDKKKAKKDKKKDESNVFGVRLESLAARDCRNNVAAMSNPDLPIVFDQLIRYLRAHGMREEGLFRKAGSAARIKAFREKLEASPSNIDLESIAPHVHDTSSALKQFLREVPDPVLTNEYIEAFAMTNNMPQQLYCIQLLVMLLPPVHRACLRLLLDFLCEVARSQEHNKMSLANLAVVFAPTLFYIRGQKGQKMLKEVEMQVTTAATLKTMLENNDALWDVPPDILAQIRFVNESRANGRKASKPKDVKRLLTDKKKEKKSSGRKMHLAPEAAKSSADPVNWVKDSAASPPVRALVAVTREGGDTLEGVEVTDVSCAGELLKAADASDRASLFEVGGNIGSRKLHNATRILPLLKVNPNGSFIVRSEGPGR